MLTCARMHVIGPTFHICFEEALYFLEALEVLVLSVLCARLCIIPPTATLRITDNVVDG